MRARELQEQNLADLLACVPMDRFETAREIWLRLGKWSPTTVSANWLPELARRGLVLRQDVVRHGNPTATYRRAAPAYSALRLKADRVEFQEEHSHMGSKNNPGKFDCLSKAEPDEPIFVLLGRDRHAPGLVRMWADLRETEGENPEKVAEARRCADEMEGWLERALRERVREALANASANGVDFAGWTDEAIAVDMLTYSADLEDEDLDTVKRLVGELRQEQAT